ncbi:response regulator transcription factor [Marinospirillum perlucidum]|uniref:response regulator transcription factor n=1 Tax=Marinospirillum perlucidum TaxID=1982602 RepID=UPI000DF39E00|nr:response regulator transcription factor [Marinospirillum perlucidum]
MQILLVSQDQALLKMMQSCLDGHYHLRLLDQTQKLSGELTNSAPDLIILEQSLAEAGYTPSYLRRVHPNLLLMLLVDSQLKSRIHWLDAGADEILIQPFHPLELQARTRALLRRATHPYQQQLNWQGLQLDPFSHEVSWKDQPLRLTPTEFQLLELLMRHPRQVFTKSQLVDHLRGQDGDLQENCIKVYIAHLRKKLAQAGDQQWISNHRGVGYSLGPAS